MLLGGLKTLQHAYLLLGSRALPAAWGRCLATADTVAYWHDILQQKHGAGAAPDGHVVRKEQLKQLLQEAIRVYSGASPALPEEVTSVFMRVYHELLGPEARLQFFSLLARDFGVQKEDINQAIAAWQRLLAQDPAPPAEAFTRVAARLRTASEPVHQSLFPPISQHRHGIPFLVRLRADLLACIQQQQQQLSLAEGAALRALSNDLRRALSSWFSLGLLQLRRVTWSNSSAELLERVRQGEAVHPMSSLEQLRQRLHTPDRRCFCFFHPSLPEVPLVILHTALLPSIPSSMSQILSGLPGAQQQQQQQEPDSSTASSTASSQGRVIKKGTSSSSSSSSTEEAGSDRSSCAVANSGTAAASAPSADLAYEDFLLDAEHGPHSPAAAAAASTVSPCTVACFYSISSTEPGLAGVDLGNFLIKKVARELLMELPHLRHLVTLSPVPGFRAWLQLRLEQQVKAEEEVMAGIRGGSGSGAAGSAGATSSSNSSSSSSSDSRGANELHQSSQQQQPSPPTAPLQKLLAREDTPRLLTCWQELQNLQPQPSSGSGGSSSSVGNTRPPSPARMVQQLLAGDVWLGLQPAVQQEQLAPVLLRLCALYLLKERRRNLALDPVANFHLRNGAELWRVNFRADLSPSGLARSHGLMVNYSYELNKVADRNRAYLLEHKVAASQQVEGLLLS